MQLDVTRSSLLFGVLLKYFFCVFKKLFLPIRYLAGMDFKSLSELSQGLFALIPSMATFALNAEE